MIYNEYNIVKIISTNQICKIIELDYPRRYQVYPDYKLQTITGETLGFFRHELLVPATVEEIYAAVKQLKEEQAQKEIEDYHSKIKDPNISKEEKFELCRQEIKKRMDKKKDKKTTVVPEPRYDEVYYKGLEWLNKL